MMGDTQVPDVSSASVNTNTLTSWIHEQPDELLVQHAQTLFEDLLASASQPRHASSTACVKLCGFVQQSSKSDKPQLVEWAFKSDTALSLFNYYIEWNEKDQHRSMRLVLDLLTSLISQNPKPESGLAIKEYVLESLISITSGRSTRPLVKSSLTSLHHLLSRDIYTLADIEKKYRSLQQYPSSTSSFEVWTCIVAETLEWLRLHYTSAPAGKLLVAIFTMLRATGNNSSLDVSNQTCFTVENWQDWLEEGLVKHPDVLENIKNYILTSLFKNDATGSLQLLERLSRLKPTTNRNPQAMDTSAMLQLAALEVGKKAGLVEDPSPVASAQTSDVVILKEEILANVLAHPLPDIRSLALSLLISSQATSRPFAPSAFSLLRTYLPVYFSDPDAKFRNEVLGHTRDMIKRVKGAIVTLQRNIARFETAPPPTSKASPKKENIKKKQGAAILPADVPLLRDMLAQHEDFFGWFLDFLRSELVPTASYPRHITALKAAVYALKVSKELVGSAQDIADLETASLVFRDDAWIRSVTDLIMDPFDDVREISTSLLMLLPRDFASAQFKLAGRSDPVTLIGIVEELSRRANVLSARTARADHADGAARLHGLLCFWTSGLEARQRLISSILDILEAKLLLAEKDLGHAAIENPIHGEFASLGYMWLVLAKEKYSEVDLASFSPLQERIVSLCKRTWTMVRHVLCDDSPEGHLPQEMEDVEGLDTKDLLSYSFRAIHESSSTMRILVSTLRFSRAQGLLFPTQTVFEEIGSLAFDQLSNLRHRGAFATVSQTYTTCCQLSQDPLVKRSDGGGETLLHVWFKGALDCIYSQASTTRRSAGIPALITGILAANANDPSFDQIMKTIGAIAREPARVTETDGSNLPQVHALNSLKDVFKSSMLSKRAEPYLLESLQLAVTCLRSEVWAIRNCGLLLLRSLIDNLFGTGESKAQLESGWDGKTVRVSYVKYPTLPDVLVTLLKPVSGNKDLDMEKRIAESVFPALDIIRRAGPPTSHRDELYEYISEYLGSHLWHVREIAARTICSFLIHQDWVTALGQLLEKAAGSTNRLHGTLLAVKFVIERLSQISPDDLSRNAPRLVEVLQGLAQSHVTTSSCSEVHGAFVEVENFLLQHVTGDPLQLSSGSSTDVYDGPAALLRIQLAIRKVYETAKTGDIDMLQAVLSKAIHSDTNTAVRMIEAIPEGWKTRKSPDVAGKLCNLHIEICTQSTTPEVRAPALDNLADGLNYLVDAKEFNLLPSSETLTQLWTALQRADINPAVSHAILRASGPIMAIQCLRSSGDDHASSLALSKWASLMSDAGNAENTFDTRFAAVTALNSFAAALGTRCKEAQHLPFLLALYDCLNDDDEEVRDLAASAAGALLGEDSGVPLPIQAPDLLLEELPRLDAADTFKTEIASRIIGATTGRVEDWIPAETQLAETMQFDDALFVIEEQNLFIDEVRETQRWAGVLRRVQFEEDSPALMVMGKWSTDGLRVLIRLAGSDDGPIGWSSKPEVFAICTRIILGCKALAAAGHSAVAAELLREFRDVGEKSRVHGGLLAAAQL